jgi:signal transduction histidine kinase
MLAEESPNSFQLQIDSGAANLHQGNYPTALNHFFNALKIGNEEKSVEKTASAHVSIGTTYYRMRDWDKALEHLNTAEEMTKKTGDEVRLADIFYKKGIVYDEIPGETQTAFTFLNKALNIYKKENNCEHLADIYNALAGHYYMQRKTDSVAYYAKLALEKYGKCGTVQQQAAMNINIASLLNSQLKHTEALEYNQKGIELARSINSFAQLRQGYKNLSETYAYMKQYDEAYRNRVLYDQYKDSVFSTEKSRFAEEMTAKYEGEKKDLMLAEKEIEITKQKFRFFGLVAALIIAIILIGSLYYIAFRRRVLNRRLSELNTSKDKLFSIISHDLKAPVIAQQNALNSLIENITTFDEMQILTSLKDFQSATDTQLDLLQNLLSWANMHTGRMTYKPVGFHLSEVIQESTKLYALLARNKGIEIDWELDSNCTVYADRQMIQTVIRNLINNAIKFTNENGKITLSCSQAENAVKVTVKDNGVGMSQEVLAAALGRGDKLTTTGTQGELGSGLGLIICRELLERNNSSLHIESVAGEGSEVSFKLEAVRSN